MQSRPPAHAASDGKIRIHHARGVVYGHTRGSGTPVALMEGLKRELDQASVRQAYWLTQQHTSRVIYSADHPPGTVADGFVLASTGTVGIIRTADCTPLFFWDDSGKIAGLVHVGWRGLAAGILENLLCLLDQHGAVLSLMNVWLGPAIDGGCYPVGNELPDFFKGHSAAFWGFSPGSGGRWSLDVRKGTENVLRAAGIPARRIQRSPICTFCEAGFPSYRRRGAECGRILNFILRLNLP